MRHFLLSLCICLIPLLARAEKAEPAQGEIIEFETAEGEVIEVAKNEDGTIEIPIMEIDFGSDDFHTATMGPDDTISVDFPDERVITIIRNIADLYDLNVVIPDTLDGVTSIKLRNVTWRQVFQIVLEPMGYTFSVDGNIVHIYEVGLTAGDYIEIGVIVVLIFSLLLNAILAPCVFVLVWNRKKA